jgi:hypothetical protein
MRAITVNWSYDKGEAKLSLSTEFKNADWITRADILQDALYDLEELYNKTLGENT